jgi:hypothetical protein
MELTSTTSTTAAVCDPILSVKLITDAPEP